MHLYSIMYQNIVLKGLSLFNKCSSYFSSVKQYVYHTCDHLKQFLFNYNHSQWIFMPGHSIPLPLSLISNQITYYWKYDSYINQLIYHSIKTHEKYVLSVLSAKLLITDTVHGETKEYDMDPFLETFSVYTNDQHPPTLQMIFLSWCASHKVWFPADCSIHIEYIDHMGNFVNVTLADDIILRIQQNKLYITPLP